MSRLTSKLAPVMVGLVVAVGAASPALADTPAAPSIPTTLPALPGLSLPSFPALGGGELSGKQKCQLLALSLGPLYFIGPFGSLGPWGPNGPMHGDKEHPCFGGGAFDE